MIKKHTENKVFDLDELQWSNKARMDKKKIISEVSKDFFKKVFVYNPDDRIDLADILELPLISELKEYKQEQKKLNESKIILQRQRPNMNNIPVGNNNPKKGRFLMLFSSLNSQKLILRHPTASDHLLV